MVFLVPGAIAHGVALLLGYRNIGVPFYLIAFFVTIFGGAIVIGTSEYVKASHFRTRLQILKNQGLGPSLVLHAGGSEELHYWLGKIDLDLDEVTIRSLLRLLRSPHQYQAGHPIFGLPLFELDWNESSVHKILNLLMMELGFIQFRNSSDSSLNALDQSIQAEE